MHRLLFASFATLVAACSTSGTSTDEVSPPICPVRWRSDPASPGGCRPADEIVSQTKQQIGSGATGFLRVTTGVCGLCGDGCSCDTRLVPSAEVRAVSGKETVARAVTSADGVFALSLAPGAYELVTRDPESGADVRQPVAIGKSDVAIVPILFDHGAY